MEKQTEPNLVIASNDDIDVAEMMKVGAHVGRKRSASHPKMKPYVFAARNDIQMIHLDKTKERLSIALDFLKNAVKNGGTVLLVGTKPQLKEIVRSAAIAVGMPYVVERWIGGTITNWGQISQRLNYFLELEDKKKSGELEKYTKHEQLKFAQELERLEKTFGGLRSLKKPPEVIFIVDAAYHEAAILEARRTNIPVVALADTNANPDLINYLIPVNSDGVASVKYVLDRVVQGLGKK